MNIVHTMLMALCVTSLMAASASSTTPNFTHLDSLIQALLPQVATAEAAVTPVGASEVVILKVTGEVTVDWADSLEMVCKSTTNPKVILWIESGGGGTQATAILSHRVLNIKNKYHKMLIVYTETFLCSGAYWLACVGDSLYASPAAIVGSIGVYIARTDITAYDSANGGKYDVIKTGKLKDAGDQHTKMTKEERQFWQEWVDKSYVEFINHVYSRREAQLTAAWDNIREDKSPKAMLVRLADGRVYTAAEALHFGLIDRVLYIDDMISQLGENVTVKKTEVSPPASFGFTHPMVK